ncbi:hypothetical protein GCM10011584_28100 [Nocardioides phosphati]|uniref:DUF4157 domain-containing protein n=1 Tax=Nocardioides phosphati TaxID=1867775 RepID=A0ABQ2NEA2_9ACTN|nr:hypothetical protein [Nocardioides phosphati]GGO92216.1 hypothetical protein GCM10011584_28100 [Nocardioides phosphati]
MKRVLRPTLAGLVCTALLLPAGCSPFGDDKPKGPTYPKAWDARVVPYVKLAAKLRHLEFKHPVKVEFQTPKVFEKGLAADEDDLDAKDRKELEQFTGMLRALGLVHGKVDLFKEQDKLNQGGTLAYYSFDDKQIRVRGTRITPAVRSTLVHELVHVLQDQNFDAGARSKKLSDADDSSGMAYDALVEGDARRIETKYAAQLGPKARRALQRDRDRQTDDAEESIKGVPEVLQTMMGVPYVLGEALLAVATLDGEDEVDKLFRKPPTTEENLVDPFTITWDDEHARTVGTPTLEKGQKKLDSGTFESTGWLFTLAARLPLPQALQATDGWGGDHYVAYTEDHRTCVKVRYVGDTARDAHELHTALTRWIARGPAGTASVKEVGDDGLLFTSCDPGTDAKGSGEHSDAALELAVSRTYVARSLLQQGWPHRQGRCFATELVSHFTPAEIQAKTASPELTARFRAAAQRCR